MSSCELSEHELGEKLFPCPCESGAAAVACASVVLHVMWHVHVPKLYVFVFRHTSGSGRSGGRFRGGRSSCRSLTLPRIFARVLMLLVLIVRS